MTTFTILLGGTLVPSQRLRSQIANTPVIAADGGIRHARTLALDPLLWLGDFDSADKRDTADFAHVPQHVFSPDKDKTDGELAVDAARERGADRLILCGAFGGERTDHTLLHTTMGIALMEKNITVLLTSGIEEGWPLIAGQYCFDFPRGSQFSIIALSPMKGLTIQGAKWSVDQARLFPGSSFALSNQVCGNLSVSLTSGKGILLVQPAS